MEERNIKITLEKAKEWYNQGGDLKEVALQAFSENELKVNFPTSWDAFAKSKNYGYCSTTRFMTMKQFDAYNAIGKLIQLRDEYWRLDNNWTLPPQGHIRYIIYNSVVENKISTGSMGYSSRLLQFRTEEIKDMFYNNFKDLIEQAKMFL